MTLKRNLGLVRDLMVGNKVRLISTKYVIQVNEIRTNDIVSHFGQSFMYSEIEEIPLDENQILALGFSKWEGKNSNELTYSKGNFFLHKRKRGYVTYKREGIVRYVNELQNRYYVTRGKHL